MDKAEAYVKTMPAMPRAERAVLVAVESIGERRKLTTAARLAKQSVAQMARGIDAVK